MIECSACGTELKAHDIRCPTCGKVTAQYHRQRRCIHCGTPAAAQAKTCLMCHKPVDHLPLSASGLGSSWIGIALGVLVIVGLAAGFNRYQQGNQQRIVQARAATPTATPTFTPSATGTSTPLPPTETPTPTPTPTITPRVHVIASGETLLFLSQRYGIPLNVLTSFNRMSESEILDVGQEILIPPPRGGARPELNDDLPPQIVYVIQSGDTLSGIAYDHGTTIETIRVANPGANLELIFPGQEIVVPLSTPTPTGTPTPSPTDTPIPSPEYPAPYLLSPAAGEVIDVTTLLLNWTSPRLLAEDEYFVVQLVWPNDQVTEHWLKTNSFRISTAERQAAGQARWTVTIRRQTGTSAQGEPTGPTLSPISQSRTFDWR